MDSIKNVAVIGAGLMGHGIAQAFAQGGCDVTLQDILPQALERADRLIKSSLETQVEAGLIENGDMPTILKRIRTTESLASAIREADLVIECIAENKEAKQQLFQQLDQICPPQTLLASNTTFLNIFEFVNISRPDKLLIMHWYAPAQIIPLVDIVKGPQTTDSNIKRVANILKKIGKKPIVFNKPIAGYAISRIQIAFQREVYYLLDNDYLSPQDIDEAAIWGLALRMMILGICQRIDFGGLDLSLKTASLSNQLTPLDYQPKKLRQLVEEGAYGVKAGRGFYDYHDRSEAEVYRQRDLRLLKLLKLLRENPIAGPL
jgi:3-hydroxybutyryl-CoA dehydrogenase